MTWCNYFKFIHASWLSPVIAVALAFGVLAGVLTWVAGPSKGIFAVGKAGYLPPFFQKTNKLGVQKNILLVQGLAVTFLSLLFVVMPSVQSFYQILSQLTVILYLCYCGSSRSVHYLCCQETVLGGSEYCVRTVPLGSRQTGTGSCYDCHYYRCLFCNNRLRF